MAREPNKPHKKGEFYDSPYGIRRLVRTTIHKDCGGQVLPGWYMLSYKTQRLRNDGTLGCCKCFAQPLTEEDTYQDYC